MILLRLSFLRHSTIKAAAAIIFVSAFVLPAVGSAQTSPAFTKIIVFGDSLSDTGNIAHRVRNKFGFNYPSGIFDYSDYRFTNSSDTVPGSDKYAGVWHEQLARTFLHLPVATNSLDGGTNYAFGGATTKDGSTDRTVVHNPNPFAGGDYHITIDNMGKQVADYLAAFTPDPNALYLLWGGGNDLFDDSRAANVITTSTQVNTLDQAIGGGRRAKISGAECAAAWERSRTMSVTPRKSFRSMPLRLITARS